MLRRSLSLLTAGSLYFATPASSTAQVAVPITRFNVMSMSIAGLPANFDPCGASDDDKELNTMYIAMKMSHHNYGVINVQEDFSYHATLYQYDNHLFRTASSGDIPSSSGLNTLSQFAWVDFSSIPWNSCSNTSKKDIDCMVNKGFTFMRVRVQAGVYIDMINLHTGAGTGFYDQIARRSNIQQVVDFISANSTGNAVIVFGNTNSLYTRSQDNIRLFTTQNDLTDAWVQAIGGNTPAIGADTNICNCEVMDKVFYRGSPIINLTSSGFYYDTSRFRSPEGNMLTDHNPVRGEFGYTLKDGLRQSDLHGGSHGRVYYTWFNDLPSIPSSPKLLSITLRGGKRLDGLTLTLTSGHKFTHGGSGGDPDSLRLISGEYITSVELCLGQKNGHIRNSYAQVTTNKNRIAQAGKKTSNCTTFLAPNGYGVVGVYGQDGDEMDQLGFIYAQQ